MENQRGPACEPVLFLYPGRTFWVLDSGNVMADALPVSLDKSLEWATGFLFGNTELSLELWTVIAGISGFDD